MDLKAKIRTYNFWISLASAVLVVLRLVGEFFNFKIDSGAFMDITTAVCGVLVVLGIIIMPTSTSSPKSVKTKNSKGDEQLEEIMQNAQNGADLCSETDKNLAFLAKIGYEPISLDEAQICEQSQPKVQNELSEAEHEIDDFLDRFQEQVEESKDVDAKELISSCLKLLTQNPDEIIKLIQELVDETKNETKSSQPAEQ